MFCPLQEDLPLLKRERKTYHGDVDWRTGGIWALSSNAPRTSRADVGTLRWGKTPYHFRPSSQCFKAYVEDHNQPVIIFIFYPSWVWLIFISKTLQSHWSYFKTQVKLHLSTKFNWDAWNGRHNRAKVPSSKRGFGGWWHPLQICRCKYYTY